MIVMIVCSIFCGASIVFLMSLRVDHKSIWRVVVFMVALVVGTLAVIWAMAGFDKCRTLDYDWGDWKLRKD